MNNDAEQPSRTSDSDNSSASPAASGSSDRDDEVSSAETTPPPHSEAVRSHRKQDSTASSGFSRSYQSVFSTSEGPATNSAEYHHDRHWSSSSHRPVTAGTSIANSYPGEDQADLAAAVGLLSCSYGTPQTGPMVMPSDVPPVPPLPARYQSQHHQSQDVDMGDASSSDDDTQTGSKSNRYSRAEEDDGIFGQMEE